MTDGSHRWQELDSVLDRVLDGIYDDRDVRRLNEILRADAEARRRYVRYVELHGRLAWGDAAQAGGERDMNVTSPTETAIVGAAACVGPAVGRPGRYADGNGLTPPIPFSPVVIETSPDLPASFSPFGSFFLSYTAAAVIVGVGLLLGWVCQVSVVKQQIAQDGVKPALTTVVPPADVAFVGRITGMFDCQWSDSSTAAIERAYVPLGRRYALASGLMEISYDSGAKVILQGPCIYEVQSKTGGYLARGKLTAKVAKQAEAAARKSQRSHAADFAARKGAVPSTSPLSSAPFVVCTPTAIVTDLGTEFGVDVDKSGASEAHVFRGKVEVRVADGGNAQPLALGDNESGRVESGKGRAGGVVRAAGLNTAFVREMPKSVPIELFNTGGGLKEGDPDPHWQVVARSDDPKFKPRPAVVVPPGGPDELENDAAHSQWLSPLREVVLPEEVVYVFRTTFDLTGKSLSKAVLQGKFIADDRVVAIRLNGHGLNVPLQHEGEPFIYWSRFFASSGFVKGTNVLEIDVLNANPFTPPGKRRTARSRVCCRVELEGAVLDDPASIGDGASGREAGRTLSARKEGKAGPIGQTRPSAAAIPSARQ
jgi:hypothetical protein